MRNALIYGILFLAFGILGLLFILSLGPHNYCMGSCTFRGEPLIVKYALRIYALVALGVGTLFVLIGLFGNSISLRKAKPDQSAAFQSSQ